MWRLSLIPVLLVTACGLPSVSRMCDDVAVKQCERCYSCEIDGDVACSLQAGADQRDCEVLLADRCAAQATTLEQPKQALELCEASLDDLTCSALVRAAAQDSPRTTQACVYFL